MSFYDDNPDGGCWCSRQDCVDVIADLENILKLDEDVLNRCIVSGTHYAQSIVRSRWPVAFPFGDTPPQEVREAVALIAVYRAIRPLTFSGGALEIADRLQADSKDAITWLNDLAASEVQLEAVLTQNVGRVVRCGPPRGEAGFGA